MTNDTHTKDKVSVLICSTVFATNSPCGTNHSLVPCLFRGQDTNVWLSTGAKRQVKERAISFTIN